MMRLLSIVLFLIITSFSSFGQVKTARKFAKSMDTESLYNHLAVLASDSLQGRETGTIGQKKAANYIKRHFQKLGLKPIVPSEDSLSYFQEYTLYRTVNQNIYLSYGDSIWSTNGGSLAFFGTGNSEGEKVADLLYLVTVDSIPTQINLKNKFVLLSGLEGRWRNVAERMKNRGAAAVIVANAPNEHTFRRQVKTNYPSRMSALTLSKPDNTVNNFLFFVGPSFKETIFGTSVDSTSNVLTAKIKFNVNRVIEEVKAENVLGFLEGTDLKDEVLVVTSHYDHIGIINGKIHNGADDDGSGTTAVLALAETFVRAKKKKKGPRRSILFMTVSGEEKGLLGSKYYTRNPIVPLGNTVADLNIDMIGRVDDYHKENQDYIYLIGSDKLSQDLHELSENTNASTEQLILDYKYNDENDPNRFYYRSDHYNFAKHNIPIIFYFNGVHKDYHRPTDTIDKINFDLLLKRCKLIYYTAWEIANRKMRVKLN